MKTNIIEKIKGNKSAEEVSVIMMDSSNVLRAACDTIYANAPDVGGGRFARIALDLLGVEDYQRNEDGRHVNRIAKDWNESKCDPLTVAYRDGSFYVVDGQHRLMAARLLGKTDVKCIINKLSYRESCEVFMNQNDHTKRLTVYNKLIAGYKSGIAPYTDIFEICKTKAMTLTESTRPQPGECGCVSSLLRIYNRNTRQGLLWVLDMVESIGWSMSENGYSGNVLEALSAVWGKAYVSNELLAKGIVALVGSDSPKMTISKAHARFPGRSSKAALAEYFMNSISI